MALPTRLRPRRQAQDTRRLLEDTLGLPAISPRQKPAALPPSGIPVYSRQNVQAGDYYDAIWVFNPGQNRVVLPANPARVYLLLIVIGTGAAQVAINKPASATVGLPLAGAAVGAVSGGFWEPWVPPKGAINIFSAAGTTVVVVGD